MIESKWGDFQAEVERVGTLLNTWAEDCCVLNPLYRCQAALSYSCMDSDLAVHVR